MMAMRALLWLEALWVLACAAIFAAALLAGCASAPAQVPTLGPERLGPERLHVRYDGDLTTSCWKHDWAPLPDEWGDGKNHSRCVKCGLTRQVWLEREMEAQR